MNYNLVLSLSDRTEYFDQGLWGKCFFDEELAGREGCRWVWQFEWALEKSLPGNIRHTVDKKIDQIKKKSYNVYIKKKTCEYRINRKTYVAFVLFGLVIATTCNEIMICKEMKRGKKKIMLIYILLPDILILQYKLRIWTVMKINLRIIQFTFSNKCFTFNFISLLEAYPDCGHILYFNFIA